MLAAFLYGESEERQRTLFPNSTNIQNAGRNFVSDPLPLGNVIQTLLLADGKFPFGTFVDFRLHFDRGDRFSAPLERYKPINFCLNENKNE